MQPSNICVNNIFLEVVYELRQESLRLILTVPDFKDAELLPLLNHLFLSLPPFRISLREVSELQRLCPVNNRGEQSAFAATSITNADDEISSPQVRHLLLNILNDPLQQFHQGVQIAGHFDDVGLVELEHFVGFCEFVIVNIFLLLLRLLLLLIILIYFTNLITLFMRIRLFYNKS